MFKSSYNKILKTTVFAGMMLILATSCKKEQRPEIYPASLTIVNGINDTLSVLSAYFGKTQPALYGKLAFINNCSSFDYATDKMDQPVTLYRNYDTLNAPFVKTSLQLEAGGIFTHFVYGSPGKVKQKTVKEQLPHHSVNDSVAYLRVINLFENRSVDVVQLEPVAETMVSDLAYEALSDFKKVPVNVSVKKFRFEVRDHATGTVLATMTETNSPPGSTVQNTMWLFRPRTMIVTGTWTAEGNFVAKAKSIGHF